MITIYENVNCQIMFSSMKSNSAGSIKSLIIELWETYTVTENTPTKQVLSGKWVSTINI